MHTKKNNLKRNYTKNTKTHLHKYIDTITEKNTHAREHTNRNTKTKQKQTTEHTNKTQTNTNAQTLHTYIHVNTNTHTDTYIRSPHTLTHKYDYMHSQQKQANFY